MGLEGLIVPNEPRNIKLLLHDLIECPQGYDICLFTNIGKVGIERKKIPSDLIASIEDGRLGREILAMREECKVMIILLHGVMRYNENGTLRLGRRTSYRWNEKGIRNIRRTLEFVEGCYIETARNDKELVNVVNEIQDYLNEKDHFSTKGRLPIKSDWIKSTYYERVRYWMDGLPGVGARGAILLTDRFLTPMSLFQATIEEIDEVPHIGKVVAANIYNFLRGILTKET